MRKKPPKTKAKTEPTPLSVHGAALVEAARGWLGTWKPKPRLSLSAWSAQFARLENGQRFRAFPFQIGIADAFSDPVTKQITVKKSSRIGYSQIVQNYVAWCIVQSPRRLLIYQPTIDDAEKYSRDDLDPVLQWPAVRQVAVFKPRHRDNQIRAKRFKGGWIQIKGTNSPKEFRRVTADSVLLEEPDGYPYSAGVEGDPAALAFKRCLTSDEPLKAAGSTPSIEGLSRIDALFEEGTQEHRYVPCPHCGTMQFLVFGNGSGAGIRWTPRERPTRVWYQCVTGCEIEESHKAWMDEQGEWRAHAPENGPLHRSFHIWAAYSQHEGAAWLEIAREFLAVRKDPNRLKVFVNQVLGLSWAERGEAPEWQRLYDRREKMMILGSVPDWVGILVGAVDAQRGSGGAGRLEMDVWGFGAGKKRVLVDHVEVDGDIADPATWAKLDVQVAREWKTPSGRRLRLHRVGVDSGDGLNTMHVYAWARRNPGFVMALKGRQSVGINQPIAGPNWVDLTINGRKLKQGVRLWTVGTSMLKLELYGQLEMEKPVDGEEYPEGYVFIPDGTSDEWVKQLVAEQLKIIKMRSGRRRQEWAQIRDRNEALDNAVYARAVACAVGIDRWADADWAKAIELTTVQAPPPPVQKSKLKPKSPPRTPVDPKRTANWMNRRPR